MTPKQREQLKAIYQTQAPADARSKTGRTATSALAEKYACTPRTIRAWREAGAPLGDDERMRLWLAGRKNIPPRTLAALSARSAMGKKSSAAPTNQLPAGAPAALRRLESAEVQAFTDLEAALQAGDPLAVKTARESWLKISEALRRADLAIEQARRDSGELIPRAEIEKFLFHAAFWIGHALTIFSQHMAHKGVAVKEVPDMIRFLDRGTREAIFSGFGWALENHKLPEWGVTSIKKGIGMIPGEEDGPLETRRQIFRDVLAEFLKRDFPAAEDPPAPAATTNSNPPTP